MSGDFFVRWGRLEFNDLVTPTRAVAADSAGDTGDST